MQASPVWLAHWQEHDKTMRVSLNLASRPFADQRPALKRLRIVMAALAVAAGALGLGLHALNNKAEQARAREHALDSQIAAVRQEQQGYLKLVQQPDNARLLAQIAALNRIFDEKAFSWTLAMEDLETVLPGGVQVSTLEPIRAKDGHITLHLRVAGPRDLDLDLVKNLEHSRRFLFPRIVGENADTGEGPNQKLQPVSASNRSSFDLLADYNPPAPGEYKAAKNQKSAQAGAAEAGTNVDHGADRGAAPPHPAAPRGVHRPVRPPYTGPPHPAARIPKPNPAGGGTQ
jgi:type IV pilus assembly protein PilN